MTYSFYIYYRIDIARAVECEERVRDLLAAVRKATGVSGQLMKKRGESNLWMEVYADVADDARLEWELAESAGRLKISEFLLAGTSRHLECFEH